MKYKIIGVLACLVVLASSLLIPTATSNDYKRFHQHLQAQEKEPCQEDDTVFCTHLPLVEINTNGMDIPGRAVLDENGNRIGYTTANDGAEIIRAQMSIKDSETTNNYLSDEPILSSQIQIHVRGNSSRFFDKLGYAIRLVDEQGENAPQSVMGMDKHHEWVLHGPYLDKTLIRNYMWYNIGGEIMDYAPNVRFCEMFLNGEYQGVYVMAENITAGKDGARLNLSVSKKHNTFSGYLLRLDRGSNDPLQNLNNFSKYARRTPNTIDVIYPGKENLNVKLQRAIERDFSDFEKALYSYDYDHHAYGYENYIDVSSFVDYFLINELAANYDAGWSSTYIYKDLDGKFHLSIWDFNNACDNYQERKIDPYHFEMEVDLWYNMLVKDEDFISAIIDRYYELRKTYFSEAYLMGYIDDTVKYLGDAIDRNFEKWGYSFEEEADLLIPSERNPRSYEEAITEMKTFLQERLLWMDDNIEALRQYSAESKVKKFNENAN